MTIAKAILLPSLIPPGNKQETILFIFKDKTVFLWEFSVYMVI